jgi:TetR/AcrR family transcriptional regulator, transcriptional repressor for nem operon
MKENTRQKLINATFEEVYSNGYQGAALADILAKAGVHKGSMYYFFANKKEMALSAIQEKMSERFDALYLSITKDGDNYLQKLFDLLRDTSRRDFSRGCPLANLVQEMSNLDEDFNQTLQKIYGKFREVVRLIYDKAIENNELVACDTDKLSLFSIIVLEGALLSVKGSGNIQDYTDAVEMLIEYIKNFKT